MSMTASFSSRRVAVLLAFAICSSLCAARVAAQCLTDVDCDDGLFCTTDHCILFVCAHFARDCNDFNDCTTDACNESQNICVHANKHLDHCEDFNITTTAEVCCGGECK